MNLSNFICIALLTSPLLCGAADDAHHDDDATVVITGVKNPPLMSYRNLLAGLDGFDKYHFLAPRAPEVRFRIKPPKIKEEDWDGLNLKIVGDSVTIPVPFAPDGTFVVPRSTVADDENADMVLNKKKKDFILEIEVHSPDVPADMRRLGDLRLECEVAVAMAKQEIGFFWSATVSTILLTGDWCMSNKVEIPSYTLQPLVGATLINGAQRTALKIESDQHSFDAPLNIKSYSDNLLIELQFAPEALSPAAN
jgi:hypothetical protein